MYGKIRLIAKQVYNAGKEAAIENSSSEPDDKRRGAAVLSAGNLKEIGGPARGPAGYQEASVFWTSGRKTVDLNVPGRAVGVEVGVTVGVGEPAGDPS